MTDKMYVRIACSHGAIEYISLHPFTSAIEVAYDHEVFMTPWDYTYDGNSFIRHIPDLPQ